MLLMVVYVIFTSFYSPIYCTNTSITRRWFVTCGVFLDVCTLSQGASRLYGYSLLRGIDNLFFRNTNHFYHKTPYWIYLLTDKHECACILKKIHSYFFLRTTFFYYRIFKKYATKAVFVVSIKLKSRPPSSFKKTCAYHGKFSDTS